MKLAPGRVQVLPPEAQATLAGLRVELAPRGEGGPGPGDLFLRSLAGELGSGAVAVVLSGAGSDGALGLKDVKAEGGVTFAENPRAAPSGRRSRGAPSRPEASTSSSASRRSRRSSCGWVAPGTCSLHGSRQGAPLGMDPDLSKLLRLLHAAVGVDFSQYKKSTLRRRIQRRMTLHRLATLQDYLEHLESAPGRDRGSLPRPSHQGHHVLPRSGRLRRAEDPRVPVLMHSRPQDSPVRIWVPGCSTGEEVYSLAISLLEFLEADATDHAIQIFGTDLSEAAIQQARSGIYIESISMDVSPSRLRRFFVRVQGGFQVNKSVRDLCIFSRHNAAADPPLLKLDPPAAAT